MNQECFRLRTPCALKATRQAGEDKRTLTLELAQKEQALRRVNEALETNSAQARVVQER